MRLRFDVVLLIGALAVGCGREPALTSPTPNTPNPGPGNSDGPTARITVTIDSLGSRKAVTALSGVAVDAIGSRGTSLTYRVDFGDGTTATQAVARHVYGTPGTFTVVVTIRGYYAWWQGYGGLLTFDSQDGPEVTGTFRPNDPYTPSARFTGTLSGERDIRLVLADAGIVLSGTLNLRGRQWPDWRLVLTHTGGANHGKTVEFHFRNGY